MKKIFIIITVLFVFSAAKAQSAYQFPVLVQPQNSNIHEAIVSPVPMTIPVFYVRSDQLITKIEVFDIFGKLITQKNIKNFTFNPIEVSLPTNRKGIYFIKITFDDNCSIIKKTILK